MNRLFDLQLPFFIPLWRRIAVVTVCGVCAIAEFAIGSPFFGLIFGAMGVWAAYSFFFAFDPKDPT